METDITLSQLIKKMQFKGLVKEHSKWVRPAAIIGIPIMMVIEVLTKQYFFIPLLILVFLAVFFKKEHIIGDDGVDIKYTLFGFTSHYMWQWEEITSIHIDYKKAYPNVMFHIGKDIVTRSFIYDYETGRDVIKYLDEKYPKYVKMNKC